MKRYLLLVIIVFCGCIVNAQTKKTYREIHIEKFNRYTDSCLKYSDVEGKCGRQHFEYYYRLQGIEYNLLYPYGNPYDKIKYDKVCYPMKQ